MVTGGSPSHQRRNFYQCLYQFNSNLTPTGQWCSTIHRTNRHISLLNPLQASTSIVLSACIRLLSQEAFGFDHQQISSHTPLLPHLILPTPPFPTEKSSWPPFLPPPLCQNIDPVSSPPSSKPSSPNFYDLTSRSMQSTATRSSLPVSVPWNQSPPSYPPPISFLLSPTL